MTDKELIRKVHNGNKDALNSIVQKYYDEIYRFCVFMTGQETDSYDITQEVFLKLIRYIDTCQNKNLKGYLLIIARNLCFDYFRHKKRMIGAESVVEMETVVKLEKEEQTDYVENRLFLKDALVKIPEEQREVIILRIYEELKFAEIAKMLGCNVSTVKSRYHLGIRKLKKIMEEYKSK